MKTIGDLLKAKGPKVWMVGPATTVFAALELMAARDIGGVLVVDDGQPMGIFTERDYARQVVLKGKASRDTPVAEVMTTKVIYIRSSQAIDEAMALMTEKRIRHLPVLDDGRLAGLVSIGDIVKALISEKQFVIEQLENYIHNP